MLETKTRYHLDKNYVENPLPFGNIHLLQLGRRYCAPTEIIAAHPHLNWFELTVVNNGSGTILTNGEASHVRAGDIYLSFPCDIHEIRADLGSTLDYDFFSFYCTEKALESDLKSIMQKRYLRAVKVLISIRRLRPILRRRKRFTPCRNSMG